MYDNSFNSLTIMIKLYYGDYKECCEVLKQHYVKDNPDKEIDDFQYMNSCGSLYDLRTQRLYNIDKSWYEHKNNLIYLCPEHRLQPKQQNEFINKLVELGNEYTSYIVTMSEHLFNALRVAIKQCRIDLEQQEVYFNGNRVLLDKDGRTHDWYEGFCDQTKIDLLEIIKLH